MSSDDFERQLRGQTPRQIPETWRREILNAAQASRPARNTPFSPILIRLSSLLWPHPKAWAALAAVWLVLLALNLSLLDGKPRRALAELKPSPEMILVLQQQQRLRAELVGATTSSEVDRPKSNQPRSERSLTQVLT